MYISTHFFEFNKAESSPRFLIKIKGSQKCSTLLQTLSSDQLDDFQEIIKETFPDGLNNNQVPEFLEFMLKVIENIIKVNSNKEAEKIIHPPLHIKIPNKEAQAVNPLSKGKPSGTQGFELYCIPKLQEEGNSEILVNNNEDLEEKGIELNSEVVLDKLLTICLEALKWLPRFENPKPESNSPLKIINGGNDLADREDVTEMSNVSHWYQNRNGAKDEFKKFEDYEQSGNVVCKAKIKVKKVEKNDTTKDNKIIDEIEVVEKTSKMDHVNIPFEFSLKNDIDVERETTWNYRKTAEIDRKRKMEKLEEMNPEEKIMYSNALDESDCKTLVEDDVGMNEGNNDNKFELPLEGDALNCVCEEWVEKVNKWMEKVNEFQKVTSEINGPTKMKLTKEMVKDCSHNRIEVKMDKNKESSCCRKSGELDNMIGTFMVGNTTNITTTNTPTINFLIGVTVVFSIIFVSAIFYFLMKRLNLVILFS
ncbi:hypothetical protein C2G38_2137019 [Gigaspora rosea]|uniref:Uncharacterized protein n=1 Tax=Gigaspora rosea TaxID=44941 RepID=A0A397W313_9GLOM|nr:hypothetical protein C2G38_2137019 [Gigaspora rosea]